MGSPMNDYWRKGRKFAAAMTGPSMATQYESFLAREVKWMVVDMVRNTSKYQFWFERVSSAVSTRQLFGEKCARNGDVEYHTKQIVIHNRHFERTGSAGAYLVNLFPPLNYLPEALAPFKREAKQFYARDSAYFFSLLQQAIQRYEEKVPEDPKSFVRCWLEREDRWGMSFTEAAYVLWYVVWRHHRYHIRDHAIFLFGHVSPPRVDGEVEPRTGRCRRARSTADFLRLFQSASGSCRRQGNFALEAYSPYQ